MRFILLSALALALPFASRAQAPNTEAATHARLAQQYLAQHQPAKAIPELRAVLALEPQNTEVRANLGVLLFFENQYAEAVPNLRAAVEAKPDLYRIRALLGTAERRTGEEQAARTDLEATYPHLDSSDPKLKANIGRELIESYAATDDLDKASDTIADLLKLQPTDPGLLYISYRIHTQMATAALLELGLSAPASAQTHQAIAHELQRDRNLPATIANLRQALALDPNLPGIHFELAEALHASDDQRLREESRQQYKLAVDTSPGDPKAITRMADVQLEDGQLEAAAESYQNALKLQPSSTDAAIGLANVYIQQARPAEALPLLERVENADPTNALAHFRLSAVYRKLNRPDDVKRELDLYKRYKEEREKLQKLYQQLRIASPGQDAQPETQKAPDK